MYIHTHAHQYNENLLKFSNFSFILSMLPILKCFSNKNRKLHSDTRKCNLPCGEGEKPSTVASQPLCYMYTHLKLKQSVLLFLSFNFKHTLTPKETELSPSTPRSPHCAEAGSSINDIKVRFHCQTTCSGGLTLGKGRKRNPLPCPYTQAMPLSSGHHQLSLDCTRETEEHGL